MVAVPEGKWKVAGFLDFNTRKQAAKSTACFFSLSDQTIGFGVMYAMMPMAIAEAITYITTMA